MASPLIDRLRQDVVHALRGLRRAPGFTAVVMVTLALGIGVNVAMFDVADRLLSRPLAYLRDPDRVHRIYWQWDERQRTITTQSTQYTRYLDLQRGTTSFEALAAFSERALPVWEGEASRELRVGAVSASFFSLFDAPPSLGRYFAPDEDVTPVGASVVVLSHDLWQSAFGGRDVRGEILPVGNVRATIMGVTPRGFNGVNDANPPALYLPITTWAGSTGTNDARTYFTRYQWGWVHILARRKASVTREAAELDAASVARRSWHGARADDPSLPPIESARPRIAVSAVRPGAGPEPALEARTARWVVAVALIVLLIACANVSNLILARALRRRHETAIRQALGVSRARLAAMAMTESLMLAMSAGAVGLLVAQWTQAAFRGVLVPGPGRGTTLFADPRVLTVTLGAVIVVGMIVGLAPALLLGRGDIVTTLRGGARGGVRDGHRVRAGLLVAQGALSVALLVGATLFSRSLREVTHMPLGYDAERVLLVNRVLRGAWPGESAIVAQREVLLSTAQALPGVESAAWIVSAPFVSTSNTSIFVDGVDSTSRLGTFTYQATTPDYFRTMGTSIVRGRAFGSEDVAGTASVAVVSASMARVLWPGEEALGKCFRMRADTMPCVTVIGVAEDMVQRDLTATERYHYYLPAAQFTRSLGNGLLLRLSGDPAVEGPAIQRALQRVVTGGSWLTTEPLRDIVRREQRSWRMGASVFGAFGALALLVAAVGLYGVIAWQVAQRTHELGVRVALGAQRRHIVMLVTSEGLLLAMIGVALGGMVALAASGWLQPLLFRQSARDPVVYALVAATMLAVALVATAFPALRAARANPNAALRTNQ